MIGGVFGLGILVVLFWHFSKDIIFPGVQVAGIPLARMSRAEAEVLLRVRVGEYHLAADYAQALIPVPADIYVWNITESVNRAIAVGRTTNPLQFAELLFGKIDIPLAVSLDENRLASWGAEVETLVGIPGKPAELIKVSSSWKIVNGEDAVILNTEDLTQSLLARATTLSEEPVTVPISYVRLTLTEEEQATILSRLKSLEGKELAIKVVDDLVRIREQELASFLSLTPEAAGEISLATLEEYANGLSTRYNRDPQDARFVFDEGLVEEFAPARDGIDVVVADTATVLQGGIEQLITGEERVIEVTAVVAKTPPAITTESVNNLGIVERIGRGESYYAHSIVNRVYNVGLASSRVNGALVPPGGEFSFNGTVGEISAATGYRTAYVIQNGRTELGDGGGVCQVSTTLFRAAMNAGLPITERYAHAYRVGYYEQGSKPGFDATIFSPSKDFKFKNDTPRHILIQVTNDPKNYHLVFEIYGTNDGRVATVSEARVSGISPPPPDLYQDDPTLPAGEVKQVDWAAWGAKAAFDYRVERGEETIFAKTFTSNYRPWANVYLRGTMGQ